MLCSTSKRSSHRCVTTAQREEHHFVIIIDLLHLYFFWPQIWLGRCTQWLYDRVTLATLPVSGISWWREGKWGGVVWVDGIGEWTRKLLQQNSCCIEVKPCRLDHCQQPAKEREREKEMELRLRKTKPQPPPRQNHNHQLLLLPVSDVLGIRILNHFPS